MDYMMEFNLAIGSLLVGFKSISCVLMDVPKYGKILNNYV